MALHSCFQPAFPLLPIPTPLQSIKWKNWFCPTIHWHNSRQLLSRLLPKQVCPRSFWPWSFCPGLGTPIQPTNYLLTRPSSRGLLQKVRTGSKLLRIASGLQCLALSGESSKTLESICFLGHKGTVTYFVFSVLEVEDRRHWSVSRANQSPTTGTIT